MVSPPSTRVSSKARTKTVCGTSQLASVNVRSTLNPQVIPSNTSSCSVNDRMPPVREVRVGSARTVTVIVSPGAWVRTTCQSSNNAKPSKKAVITSTPKWVGSVSNSTTSVEPPDSMIRTPR